MKTPVFEIDNIDCILKEAISYCTEENVLDVYERIANKLCNFLSNKLLDIQIFSLDDEFVSSHDFEMAILRIGLCELIGAVKFVLEDEKKQK
jgi:hypothetical protein